MLILPNPEERNPESMLYAPGIEPRPPANVTEYASDLTNRTRHIHALLCHAISELYQLGEVK